jgi:hypothetical protein
VTGLHSNERNSQAVSLINPTPRFHGTTEGFCFLTNFSVLGLKVIVKVYGNRIVSQTIIFTVNRVVLIHYFNGLWFNADVRDSH